MRYQGTVIDADTNEGVPSATVELWYGNVMLARTVASATGVFSIESASVPDRVKITSASYKPQDYSYQQVMDDSYLPIQKNIAEGEPVIVTAMKKHPGVALLLLLGVLLLNRIR